jgi:hypothetical protein
MRRLLLNAPIAEEKLNDKPALTHSFRSIYYPNLRLAQVSGTSGVLGYIDSPFEGVT